MNPQRRLWARVTSHLLEELIGIHQRAHLAFGHKFKQTHAFPLFQGKRRNRTVIYNAEYAESGKLRRGVFFITTGAVSQPAPSEQWSVGRGWGQWKPVARRLERLAGRIHDAVADEWNLDLAPLKMPVKLIDWTNDLAAEFAQRSRLDPEHPQLAKAIRRVFVRGGHESATGQSYELPHEGIGGELAAYVLAACRQRVAQRWAAASAMPGFHERQATDPPELWINLSPEDKAGVALGFLPGERRGLPANATHVARYPQATGASPAENALRTTVEWGSSGLYEIVASIAEPKSFGVIEGWIETLRAIGQRGMDGAKVWSLTRPDILESVRLDIKRWDKSFGKWAQSACALQDA